MTSGGNNFNGFSENQLTTDFAFLFKPAWGNATVSLFPLVLISFGGMAFPKKYLGERRSRRSGGEGQQICLEAVFSSEDSFQGQHPA